MAAINFKFDFEYYGAAVVEMDFDGSHYRFQSTYMGDNPLNSLINGLWTLKFHSHHFEESDRSCKFVWQDEPDGHLVRLCKKNDDLHIVIHYFSDATNFGGNSFMFEDTKLVLDTVFNFDDFTKEVCKAAINAIKKYGILGYARSWDDSMNNFDFPVAKLLYLLGSELKEDNNDLYFSDFDRELLILKMDK